MSEHITPSGYNHRFMGSQQHFTDYIANTLSMLKKARFDLNENTATIVETNAPYEIKPKTNNPNLPGRVGMLLIHGLYDSPYFTRDLAENFANQGIHCRSVLLPGHGTVPGDLLKIKAAEWVKAVDYGIQSFYDNSVDHIIVLGFSLGAALTLLNFSKYDKVKALVLLAPPLHLRHWLARSTFCQRLVNWLIPDNYWYFIRKQTCPIKYESHPLNAGKQTTKIMQKVNQYLQKTPINVPIFMTVTMEDETVSPHTAITLFKKQTHPANKLIIYEKRPTLSENSQIEHRTSAYPEENILDFSHICLAVSPDNPILGRNGTYRSFSHYKNAETYEHAETIYQGATSSRNLKQYVLQRLTYNPDFDYLAHSIVEFIEHAVHAPKN